ncbi:type II toxin-antitoxin system RelE/ParE family toxin [Fenollaria massiliensis]|uniref:Type II toxin-antitoxin system RelE/ParE family toxin n=1 Tax=Fenollaria massiliensis TaxID=938288 RepID=A0A9E7DJH1_9FIRM|nr:type II toxin-antitoxin system RelE/ParE family toxin [Fenollaria massiliensis]UQK58937.1 type II toxin-antitoxin system RelE/ParE family toxin [Fenollaria massiliensis]
MKYKILYSENAKEDLRTIASYISYELQEFNTAKKIIDTIINEINTLDTFPIRYRLCDYERWKKIGLRCMNVKNYIVFYLPDEDKVIVKILRIIYQRRDLEKVLEEN